MVKKIVIVEDEIFMREELQYILEKEGYDTFCITKFSNIIDEIISASPDLVLLDLKYFYHCFSLQIPYILILSHILR